MAMTALVLTAPSFAAGSKAPSPGYGGGNYRNSDYACVVKNTSNFSMKSYIARADSQLRAESVASNACASEATFASNCSAAQCERDSVNRGGFSVDIVTNRNGNTVEVSLRGATAGAEALVKNTTDNSQVSYYAEAPTLIEARAMAMNACVEEATFPDSCEIQHSRRY